jgi:hypothetical protein
MRALALNEVEVVGGGVIGGGTHPWDLVASVPSGVTQAASIGAANAIGSVAGNSATGGNTCSNVGATWSAIVSGGISAVVPGLGGAVVGSALGQAAGNISTDRCNGTSGQGMGSTWGLEYGN